MDRHAPVRLGLLGFGTVGQGVARILSEAADEVRRRAGRPVEIARVVVRDAERARCACDALGLDPELVGTDADALLADPDVDVVLELVGGTDAAGDWTRAAFEAGKHVVTANKALVATRGEALFEAARAAGVAWRFEAAVAGGIPVLKALEEGLAANRIEWLAGIINGTGNFILSEMAVRGRGFDEALSDAQALGYAEADPTFDVEGVDAAHKLAILASIAFDAPPSFDAVHVEGIASLEAADVGFAAELGYRIKHLGIARRRADDGGADGAARGEGLELRVHPALVPATRLLASVDGVNNAVVVHGHAVGSTLYYGAGAGAGPTGSAVVADVIDLCRCGGRAGDAVRTRDARAPVPLPPARFRSPFYLRIEAVDRPGVLAHVAGIFGAAGISIEAILQKEPGGLGADGGEPTVPIILLTREVREGTLREAVASVEALETVTGDVVVIRVETLD